MVRLRVLLVLAGVTAAVGCSSADVVDSPSRRAVAQDAGTSANSGGSQNPLGPALGNQVSTTPTNSASPVTPVVGPNNELPVVVPNPPGLPVGPGPGLPPGNIPNPVAGEVAVPIEAIFDQGSTQWCWAYSAYHTLRTYYFNTQKNDPGTLAWRDALRQLNSPEAFRQYMSSHVDSETMGDPDEFVEMLQRDKGLPSQPWQDVSPYDGFALRRAAREEKNSLRAFNSYNGLSKDGLLQKIQEQILARAPVAYCDAGHCLMIYGFVSDGNQVVSYDYADSAGGETYRQSAADVRDQMDMVMFFGP